MEPAAHAPEPPLGNDALRRWFAIDGVFAAWAAGSAILLIVAADRIPRLPAMLAGHAGALALYLGLKRLARTGRAWRAVYLLCPLAFVLLTFESLGWIIPHLRPQRYDANLAAWDLRLFGSDPTRWFELKPATAGILQLCYASYYFLPVTVVLLAFIRRQPRAVLRLNALIVSCFYATYVGYYIVPAAGPRAHFAYDAALPLGPLAGRLHALIDRLENIKLDVFPSGHTALAVLCLALAWRAKRGLACLLAPLVAGLVVSTVALRYHYGVDVLAGLAVAAVWIAIARFTRPTR